MLQLLDAHATLFKSWRVLIYEQENDAYMLVISATLQDDSQLEVRDYLFSGGTRKYAYHWMEADGVLRQRWDDAPHWPQVSTEPHHLHLPGQNIPGPSTVTNLEDLLDYLQDRLAHTVKIKG